MPPNPAREYVAFRYLIAMVPTISEVVFNEFCNSIEMKLQQRWDGTTVEHKEDVIAHKLYDEDQHLSLIVAFMDLQTLLDVKNSPLVHLVEKDYIIKGDTAAHIEMQECGPCWALSRLANEGKLPSIHSGALSYAYDSNRCGNGTVVYVIDSGILEDHRDFEGRAEWGAVVSKRSVRKDLTGHGTAVASFIGGKRYGVAKQCHLIAVKVSEDSLPDQQNYNCSDIIAGMRWSIIHAKYRGLGNKAVINVSIGIRDNFWFNREVQRAEKWGIVVCQSAGNTGQAIGPSPSSFIPVGNLLIVGATKWDDSIARFSNHGEQVNIFAPGQRIWTADSKDRNKATELSGTSLSCGIVAGVLLYIRTGMSLSASETVGKLLEEAEDGSVVGNLQGSSNVLVRVPALTN